MIKMPTDMLIEVTNRCNHKCIFCAHNIMSVQQGEIDPEFCRKILREAYDMGVRRVGLYTTGEMFLCKNIHMHIRNAKSIGYEYIFSDTNGALANKENMRKAILAGLDSIKFSINAGSAETYKTIHGVDNFDTVMENLKQCHSLKKELGINFKLLVSYIVTKLNEDELDKFKEEIAPFIDDIMIYPVQAKFLQSNDDIRYLIPTKFGEYKPSIPCPMVFNRIHITYNGYLTACCTDFNHDLILADLNEVSLYDAWRSENALKLREMHKNKQLSGIMCDNCASDEFRQYTPLSLR